MDRSVTVRYFKVEPLQGGLNFPDAIEAAYRSGRSPSNRERPVRTVTRVRLEDRTTRRGLLFGEVVRVQTENIPPEAQQNGLVPLAIGGLGHSVAFCYDRQSNIIAIQFDPRGVSLGLLLEYLSIAGNTSKFMYHPVVNDDAWERYNRGAPRKLTLSIAAPQNLERVPGAAGSVLSASRRLAEITNAPIVTVEVPMGRANGRLLKTAVDEVVRAFSSEEPDADIRRLSVTTKSEGSRPDEIDFLNDLARDQETLDLPSDDHARHLQVRYAFIERVFGPRLHSLRDMYA